MVRSVAMRPLRYIPVLAMVGALLAMTAGVVSAAASVTATPGTGAIPSPAGGNTFDLAFATIASSLDVDCGGAAVQCGIWVSKNNGPKAGETLFTNVIGLRKKIPVNFINDGCVNFRLYTSAHTLLIDQLNLGHRFVCKADGGGQPVVLINGTLGTQIIVGGGKGAPLPNTFLTVDFVSGFAFGVDVAELWIDRSLSGSPYGDCTAPTYPNGDEVLYARNVSGELTGLNPRGGGPYCFTVYAGTSHQTRISEPISLAIGTDMTYTGGTAMGGKDNAAGTIFFNSGNGALNALVCISGASVPGEQPMVYNSMGYGNKVASFQGVGAGTNTYVLYLGVGTLDASGAPTTTSCGSTAPVATFDVST